MVKLDNRGKISISDSLFSHEYYYYFGGGKNKLVTFTYINERTGKETSKRFTYKDAIKLAFDRLKDGRYANFAYSICE